MFYGQNKAINTFCYFVSIIVMITISLSQQALRNYLRHFTIRWDSTYSDPTIFFNDLEPHLKTALERELKRRDQYGFKFQIGLTVKFYKLTDENHTIDAHFTSKQRILVLGSNVLESLSTVFSELNQAIEDFQSLGSQWNISFLITGNVLWTK